MGIASLVIGVVSAILGFIPLCNYFAIIPAVVGLVLGIVYVVKQSKVEGGKKGMGIAGIVLNAAAIVLILIWTIAIAGAVANS